MKLCRMKGKSNHFGLLVAIVLGQTGCCVFTKVCPSSWSGTSYWLLKNGLDGTVPTRQLLPITVTNGAGWDPTIGSVRQVLRPISVPRTYKHAESAPDTFTRAYSVAH